MASQVLEERPFRTEHLYGARRQASEAVQPSGLRDHPGRELGAQESGQVRGPHGRGRVDRVLESAARVGHGTVEFAEAAPRLEESRVGGTEVGSGRALGSGPRRPGMVARVELGEIARDPAAEPLPDQVPDPVEVGPRSDGFLDMDGRVPGRLEGALRLLEKSGPKQGPVGHRGPHGNGKGGFRVVVKAVFREAAISGPPLGRLASAQELLLFGGEMSLPALTGAFREQGGFGRGRDGLHDHLPVEEERPEPGRDDALHEPPEGAPHK